MPNNRTTDYEGAAQLTVDLVNHSHVPDRISDAILETLIEMAGESKINVWLLDVGLSFYGLAQLYSQNEAGAGYRFQQVAGAVARPLGRAFILRFYALPNGRATAPKSPVPIADYSRKAAWSVI